MSAWNVENVSMSWRHPAIKTLLIISEQQFIWCRIPLCVEITVQRVNKMLFKGIAKIYVKHKFSADWSRSFQVHKKRHCVETHSALLVLFEGNPPLPTRQMTSDPEFSSVFIFVWSEYVFKETVDLRLLGTHAMDVCYVSVAKVDGL